MENMYVRTRYVVESDPHYNKLLPVPSEQKIWEAIVKSADFSKVFLNTDVSMLDRIFQIASDSGILRGLQVFHNHLNEKLSVPEQQLEAKEL